MSPTPPILVRPDDEHVLGPEVFGAPGVRARESVGPNVDVNAVGSLTTVHDSTFEARSGVGHHPHRRNERLFYILEGTVEHDDQRNDIRGSMHRGDLGILTEGEHGMVHSERNDGDELARAYILVHPTDPVPPRAAFDVIRDAEMERFSPGDGVEVKVVLGRDSGRVHGETYEIADSRLDVGTSLPVALEAGEGALVHCFDGLVQVDPDQGDAVTAGPGDTALVAPASPSRELRLAAQAPSRVLHVVTGTGQGLQPSA